MVLFVWKCNKANYAYLSPSYIHVALPHTYMSLSLIHTNTYMSLSLIHTNTYMALSLIHTNTYIHTYKYIHSYIQIHTFIHTNIYIHTYKYIHAGWRVVSPLPITTYTPGTTCPLPDPSLVQCLQACKNHSTSHSSALFNSSTGHNQFPGNLTGFGGRNSSDGNSSGLVDNITACEEMCKKVCMHVCMNVSMYRQKGCVVCVCVRECKYTLE